MEPGEIVTLGEEGLQSRIVAGGQRRAFCVFEYIYFARPDSRMNGQVLQVARGGWARSSGARRRSRPTS